MTKLFAVIMTIILMFTGACAFAESEYVDNSETMDLSEVTIVAPAPTPNPNRSIRLYIKDEKESYEFGESITFAAELTGYEWCENISYQWQTLVNEEWVDIEGATEIEYTFTITEENCYNSWRVKVICKF